MVRRQLTEEQRIFIVQEYYSCKRSISQVIEAFAAKFGTKRLHASTITRTIHRFTTTGSILPRPRSGRPIGRTPANIAKVNQLITADNRLSIRTIARRTKLKRWTVEQILKEDLKLHPYKVQVLHELKDSDFRARKEFCEKMLDRIDNEGLAVFDNMYFTDEAWFTLTGYVNRQNSRQWAQEKPSDAFITTSLHPEKVGVWAAISRTRVVGPVFFTSTVNTATYLSFLDEFVNAFTSAELDHITFQQDGAPAHTSQVTMERLYTLFPPDQVISRPDWPARSCDLTPPDNFLWHFLKDHVYRDNPQTLDKLKTNIVECIAWLNCHPEILKNVFKNQVKRYQLCVAQNGRQFEHLLTKSEKRNTSAISANSPVECN